MNFEKYNGLNTENSNNENNNVNNERKNNSQVVTPGINISAYKKLSEEYIKRERENKKKMLKKEIWRYLNLVIKECQQDKDIDN